MKHKLLTVAAIATSLVGSAQADQTIRITGATAFRSAASTAITSAFGGAGSCKRYYADTAEDGVTSANMTNSSYMAWQGTFPNLPGTTTILATWNGSVEGVRALIAPSVTNSAKYIPQATINAVTVGNPGHASFASVDAAAVQATADLAFSDVKTSSTPVGGFSPPAWGWSAFGNIQDCTAPVLPTRVGMVRLREFV